MSSCCISVMYDPDAVLHHTTPHTLLPPHCSKHPLRLFHSNLSNCYSSLPFSSLSVPPSYLLYLFTHPYISPPYCIHHFTLSPWAFLQLCPPHKVWNIAHILLWMLHMHQCAISLLHQSQPHLEVLYELLLEVKQAAGDQSSKGVCHICPLCRAAVTANDNSFHQWQRRVWQPVKKIGVKFHKVATHLNSATCQFNVAVLQRTEAC